MTDKVQDYKGIEGFPWPVTLIAAHALWDGLVSKPFIPAGGAEYSPHSRGQQ